MMHVFERLYSRVVILFINSVVFLEFYEGCHNRVLLTQVKIHGFGVLNRVSISDIHPLHKTISWNSFILINKYWFFKPLGARNTNQWRTF
jgi:hypothetical protein